MIFTDLNIFLLIALALIFARFLGHLFDRYKQPAVMGEILAGILLGGLAVYIFSGEAINFFDMKITLPVLDYGSREFKLLADMGILLMLFISGLGTSLSKLKKMGKSSSFVAIGGIVVPFLMGMTIGSILGYTFNESIAIGLILVATSVGITVRTLMDLNMINTDVGTTVLGAAVIDDVLGIILLSVAMATEPAYIIGIKAVIFFFIFLYLGLKVIDRILDLGEKIHLPKAFLSISLAILLLYSFFAEECGISGIIGAFVAGILISQTVKSRKIIDDVQTIGYGFFIPLFFVLIGASLWNNPSVEMINVTDILLFAALFVIVAIIGKIIGCGVGAKLAGMKNLESLQIGIGMIPRMELALIIVSATIAKGIFTGPKAQMILASTIVLTVVTTLITPFLIKATFKSSK